MEPTDTPPGDSSEPKEERRVQGDRRSQGIRGKRGIQGVQGVQGIVGPVGATGESAGADGVQGVQGIQGIQGAQGEIGKRGFSAKADDVPKWLLGMLKVMIPAYVILSVAVILAFYVGYRYADKERERICDAVSEVTLVQVDALIGASEASKPEVPRTPEQEIARNVAINQYRNAVNDGLSNC